MNKKLNNSVLAYIIGVALGDGNLSNPNGRAVRLRITCDLKYKRVIKNIVNSIEVLLPTNKVSLVKRGDSCVDISCYSNKWEKLLGWKAKDGSKFKQNVSVPKWIKQKDEYCKNCLRGLIETDGCIYIDRGYKMINFVNTLPGLAADFIEMTRKIGFHPNMQCSKYENGKIKHTIRISKDAEQFVKLLQIDKS